ncbi:unnamed protein product [Ectocarpus sp. 4 AP-2014]
MEERLPRRPAVRSAVYRRAFEKLPGRAFITSSCEGRGVFGVPPPPPRTRATVAREFGGNCA